MHIYKILVNGRVMLETDCFLKAVGTVRAWNDRTGNVTVQSVFVSDVTKEMLGDADDK
jgi:hypothetical protein